MVQEICTDLCTMPPATMASTPATRDTTMEKVWKLRAFRVHSAWSVSLIRPTPMPGDPDPAGLLAYEQRQHTCNTISAPLSNGLRHAQPYRFVHVHCLDPTMKACYAALHRLAKRVWRRGGEGQRVSLLHRDVDSECRTLLLLGTP